jgi:hypothetical protein
MRFFIAMEGEDAMGKYKREEVVRKLESKGLRAKYHKCTGILSHFEAPFDGFQIGNKCRGYLDFLGVKVVYRKYNTKNRKPSDNGSSRAWSFAWFSDKQAAEAWVLEQKKNPGQGFRIEKAEIVPTDGKEYRVCVQGGEG